MDRERPVPTVGASGITAKCGVRLSVQAIGEVAEGFGEMLKGIFDGCGDDDAAALIFAIGVTVAVVSAPAYAVFAKFVTLNDIVGRSFDQIPHWINLLIDGHLVSLIDENQNGTLDLSEILIARDGVALVLPIIAQFPYSLVALTI